MMGLLAKTPAVLSLNGQPQVTLRVDKGDDAEQTQHAEPRRPWAGRRWSS